MKRAGVWRLGLACLALVVVGGLGRSAAAHEPGALSDLPPAPLRMRVVAPSAHGLWLLRIDNEGDEPVRIPADVRLLSLSVQPLASGRIAPRAVVCDGPKAFGLERDFPEPRELLLQPGHSYVEQFDPRLFCFGKNAEALAPGSLVQASFGWTGRQLRKTAPFVADATRRPRRYQPVRALRAPTMILSHAEAAVFPDAPPPSLPPPPPPGPAPRGREPMRPSTSTPIPTAASASGYMPASEYRRQQERRAPPPPRRPPEPPRRPPGDDLGAHVTLTTEPHVDAQSPFDIAFSVQAHNSGDRDIFVALRARQLSFVVEGPEGTVHCPQRSIGHRVPRDLFRTLAHANHVHLYVLLAETCPPHSFDRPGLYFATPTITADDDGERYGLRAMTGQATVVDEGGVSGTHHEHHDRTLIRVRGGSRPFYFGRPRQVPTAPLPPPAEPPPTPPAAAGPGPAGPGPAGVPPAG